MKKKSPLAEHDGSYKSMFSHAIMMEWLLRRFVAEDWSEKLDFKTLEPVKTHFVGPENRRRDSDLIWRIRWKEKEEAGWFYVYVQVEFQSKPYRFMALRCLTYLCLLYEDMDRRGQRPESGRLPPVLPVVLYNGSRPWREPVEVAELIEAPPGALRPYLPSFRYLLIDEKRLGRESLEPVDNPASALFNLEQATTHAELFEGIRSLQKVTESEAMGRLRPDMLTWMTRSLWPERFSDLPGPTMLNLLEDPQMLAETVKEWPAKWLEEGREQGREEGREEGRVRGLQEAVYLQLKLKFGVAADPYADQLAAAGEDRLLAWVERLLSATSLEEVFLDES